MIHKIKIMILTLSLSLGVLAPLALPGIASAAAGFQQNNITNGLCNGVRDATGTQTDCFNQKTSGEDSLKTLAGKIINIFSIIVGIVAVIFIILGGFRYITSGGDSGKVGSAKNTLIYALVGLIIVALAQFVVHFVLTTTAQSV